MSDLDLQVALARARSAPLRNALAAAQKRRDAITAAIGPVVDSRWVWRGVWAPETSYTAGDLVEREGSTYLCVEPVTGFAPPSPPWDLVAKRGERGIGGFDGPAGQQGPAGPPGPPGPAGFAIPQLDADPLAPDPESAWVRRSGGVVGGGQLAYLFGGGMAITNPGVAGPLVYELSYRTLQNTTVRVTLT